MPCSKKRGPYKVHKQPLFAKGLKTTAIEGYRVYMKAYMKAIRAGQHKPKRRKR